jgi:hypothetical protein
VRFRFAALAAFLMLRRAAARCFWEDMNKGDGHRPPLQVNGASVLLRCWLGYVLPSLLPLTARRRCGAVLRDEFGATTPDGKQPNAVRASAFVPPRVIAFEKDVCGGARFSARVLPGASLFVNRASVAAVSPRRDEPSIIRWRSPVWLIARRVCPRGYGPFPRERILRPGSTVTFPHAHLPARVRLFRVLAQVQMYRCRANEWPQ